MHQAQEKWLKEGLGKLKTVIEANPRKYGMYKPAALEIAKQMISAGKVILSPQVVAMNTPDQQAAIVATWLMKQTFEED